LRRVKGRDRRDPKSQFREKNKRKKKILKLSKEEKQRGVGGRGQRQRESTSAERRGKNRLFTRREARKRRGKKKSQIPLRRKTVDHSQYGRMAYGRGREKSRSSV